MEQTSQKNQYVVTIIVSLFNLGYGMLLIWNSASFTQLTSDESPYSFGKLTMEEFSWVASLMLVGGLLGGIFFGYVTQRLGRRVPLIFVTIPTVISCLLLLFAQNVTYLYASRLLVGIFGVGAQAMLILFVSEIASDQIRGTLVSTLTLNEFTGSFLAFIFGVYINMFVVPICVIVTSILFAVLFYMVPESPFYLVKQNQFDKAELSIRFYKNLRDTDTDNIVLAKEINKIKNKLTTMETVTTNKIKIKHSMAIFIGILLELLLGWNGVAVTNNYTAFIFEQSGSILSPNSSSIIVFMIQIIATCVGQQLVDRIGRKILMTVAGIGVFIGLSVLGLYFVLKQHCVELEMVNWIPIVSCSWIVFIVSMGLDTVISTIESEIMPANIRDVGVSFCKVLSSLFNFINLKFLPLFSVALGFSGSMFMFAGMSLVCTIIVIIFLPETKVSE